MLKYLCGAIFWGGFVFNVFSFLIAWATYKSNKPIIVNEIQRSIDFSAKAYADEEVRIQPWFVISSTFAIGVVEIICGAYLQVFALAWVIFGVSYFFRSMLRYNHFFHPVWDKGEKILDDRRYDKMFKALDGLDDYNRRTGKFD